MKKLLSLLLLALSIQLNAQIISGIVTDKHKTSIPGANVFLKNTYQGIMTDTKGRFSFKSNLKGKQSLIISFLGYKDYILTCDISKMNNLNIILKEKINKLNAVSITAGSFSAGDKSKITALNSIDVVTTAGSVGNLVAAFQKLPGATINAENGRLFIRGGNSAETQTFIDGMKVFKAYSSSPNNIPTRSRYSPMLFKGMNLSTGGYSAEYGQALSGILLLDTKDIPAEETTDISIMSVGVGLGKTIKKENSSLTFSSAYTNLKPYSSLFPDKYDWIKPYESFGGEAVYRKQLSNGLLKIYTGISTSNFHLYQDDINYKKAIEYKTKDNDIYLNTSYRGQLNDKLLINTGISYSYSKKNDIATSSITNERENKGHNLHAKLAIKKIFNESFKINMGTEHFFKDIKQNLYSSEYKNHLNNKLTNNISAIFTEAHLSIANMFAIRLGLRGEYSDYTKKFNIAPRISLAQKISEHNQISFAYGIFHQESQDIYRIVNTNLINEKSEQYLFNFQHNSHGRMLRAEIYYKKYSDLIKYDKINNYKSYNNNGKGYAQGLDILWKDSKSVPFLEYRLSYSFIDTKRDYLYYNKEAMTPFTAKHNLSLVCKYWLAPINSLLGISYSYNSGRAYNNPNKRAFMNEKSKDYNDVSLSWSYLISQQKILFISISNIFGFDNVYSHKFTNTANSNGIFESMAIKPSAKRFFMAGLFITISKDKDQNQLDYL